MITTFVHSEKRLKTRLKIIPVKEINQKNNVGSLSTSACNIFIHINNSIVFIFERENKKKMGII